MLFRSGNARAQHNDFILLSEVITRRQSREGFMERTWHRLKSSFQETSQPPEIKMKLVSPTSYKYLKKWFTIKWLHGHPYVWNDEGNSPELTNSKISLTLWYFNVLIFFGNFTFVQFRTAQVYSDTSATAMQKMYMTLINALWFYEALLRIVGLRKRREIVGFLQEFFRFVDKYSGWNFYVEK